MFSLGASRWLPLWRHPVCWLWRQRTKTITADSPWWGMSKKDCRMHLLPRWVLFYPKTGMVSFVVYLTEGEVLRWVSTEKQSQQKKEYGWKWQSISFQEHEETYCKRFPLDCENKCGHKGIPRGEVTALHWNYTIGTNNSGNHEKKKKNKGNWSFASHRKKKTSSCAIINWYCLQIIYETNNSLVRHKINVVVVA